MTPEQISYVEGQMLQVAPLPIYEDGNGQFMIQLFSDKGCTKHLNITNEQFSKIEDILLGVK